MYNIVASVAVTVNKSNRRDKHQTNNCMDNMVIRTEKLSEQLQERTLEM